MTSPFRAFIIFMIKHKRTSITLSATSPWMPWKKATTTRKATPHASWIRWRRSSKRPTPRRITKRSSRKSTQAAIRRTKLERAGGCGAQTTSWFLVKVRECAWCAWCGPVDTCIPSALAFFKFCFFFFLVLVFHQYLFYCNIILWRNRWWKKG